MHIRSNEHLKESLDQKILKKRLKMASTPNRVKYNFKSKVRSRSRISSDQINADIAQPEGGPDSYLSLKKTADFSLEDF